MLIVQISDTHVVSRGKRAYDIAPTSENLSLCIGHINQLVPRPDLVLVTGDITNASLAAEFDRSVELLGRLHCPFYVIPGNQDNRSMRNVSTSYRHYVQKLMCF